MERFNTWTTSRGFKVLILVVLIFLFLIPTGMIRGIIDERRGRSLGVEEDIMSSWGSEYIIQGPVIRIPCRERNEIRNRTAGGEQVAVTEKDFDLWMAPETLEGNTELHTEIKKRSIFSVPLFSGTVRLSGNFNPALIQRELKENQQAYPENAELVIALADQRGIRGVERARWNGEELDFLSGNKGFGITGGSRSYYRDGEYVQVIGAGGIYASSPIKKGEDNHFEIVLEIQGGKSLGMVPLGEDSVFTVNAGWVSPSFQGACLPVSYTIGEKGFEARWELSRLSRSISPAWMSGDSEAFAGTGFSSSLFRVDFLKPLDHYGINTRAAKYALLFIIIPFLSFFLFEVFLKRNIHPVQYLLVGIANVVFYLLLLSISEHLSFTLAYGISALAVIAITTLYAHSLLGSWGKCWITGFIMILCYSFLYFTLQSEDWALLAGSTGIFVIVALVMFFTRKIDWTAKSFQGREIAVTDVET
jgi:inner membrane protein